MAPTNTNLVVGIEADAGGIKNGVAQASASLRGLSATMRQTGAAAQNALGGKAVQGFWRAQSGEQIWSARSTPLSAAEIFPDFKEPAKAARELGTSVAGVGGGMSLATAHTSRFSSMLSAAVPVAAALFSARLIGGFVAGVSLAIDETAKLSRSLGASVEGVNELKFAADLAGMSASDLTQNMQLMTRRIGSGMASTPLAKLGLDAEKLKNQQADKNLMEIVTALSAVPNATARAAIAMDIFGRSGIKMLNLVSEGPQAIKAMAEEARALGIVTSDDTARGFEQLNDDMTRVSSGLKGFATTVMSAAMPALKTVAWYMQDAAKAAVWYTQVLTHRLPPAADKGQEAFDALIEKQRELAREAVNSGRITAEEFEKLNAKLDARAKAGPPKTGAAAVDEDAMEQSDAEWKAKVLRAREIEASMRSDLQKRKDEIMEIQRLENEGLLKKGTAAAAEKAMRDEPRKAEEARMRAEASAMMVNNMTPAERFQESLADMDRLLKAGMLSAEDYNRQLTAISKTYTEAEFGDQMRQFEADKQKGKGLAESMMTPWEKARANMAEAEDLFSKGLIDAQTLQRTREKEFGPLMAAEQQRMRDMMGEVPQEAARSIDALSGGDIVGQVRRGQLGGAMDLQQEQLNTQKRMEKWLAILAGGGVTPAFSWGR